MLELRDELTVLTLAPAVGGSIVNWSVRATGQPLLRHSDELAISTGLPGKLGVTPWRPGPTALPKAVSTTPTVG